MITHINSRTAVGTHVELSGAVGPSCGGYTVDVDDRAVGNFNASRNRFSPQTLFPTTVREGVLWFVRSFFGTTTLFSCKFEMVIPTTRLGFGSFSSR